MGTSVLLYDLLFNTTAEPISIRPYIIHLGTYFRMDLPSYESLLEEQVSLSILYGKENNGPATFLELTAFEVPGRVRERNNSVFIGGKRDVLLNMLMEIFSRLLNKQSRVFVIGSL